MELDRWSHECCGNPLERGDDVSLTCVQAEDELSGADLLATNHAGKLPWSVCSGRVLDLSLFDPETGQRQPIQRIPSGRALRGFDESDDGLIYPVGSEESMSPPGSRRFLVRVGSAVTSEVDPAPWLRSMPPPS